MIFKRKNSNERVMPVPGSPEAERLANSSEWELIDGIPLADPDPEDVDASEKKDKGTPKEAKVKEDEKKDKDTDPKVKEKDSR